MLFGKFCLWISSLSCNIQRHWSIQINTVQILESKWRWDKSFYLRGCCQIGEPHLHHFVVFVWNCSGLFGCSWFATVNGSILFFFWIAALCESGFLCPFCLSPMLVCSCLFIFHHISIVFEHSSTKPWFLLPQEGHHQRALVVVDVGELRRGTEFWP